MVTLSLLFAVLGRLTVGMRTAHWAVERKTIQADKLIRLLMLTKDPKCSLSFINRKMQFEA